MNWENFFRQRGAIFEHDGTPNMPHPILTSVNHSSSYFNSAVIYEDPQAMQIAATALSDIYLREFLPPDRVVGPFFGGIHLADHLALVMGVKTGFTEPSSDPTAVDYNRFATDETVLMVDDVVTTGLSTGLSIQALETSGSRVMPIILSLCNRSGGNEINDRRLISLYEMEAPIYHQNDCKLCHIGSRALRPRSRWDEFVKIPT